MSKTKPLPGSFLWCSDCGALRTNEGGWRLPKLRGEFKIDRVLVATHVHPATRAQAMAAAALMSSFTFPVVKRSKKRAAR